MANFQKKLNIKTNKIHSLQHELADQFYQYYNKKEKFGLFLGLINIRGENWAFEKLSQMKTYRLENNKKYPIQWIMKK